MKFKKFCLTVLMVLILAVASAPAWAIVTYNCTSLTGGAGRSLDVIAVGSLTNGDRALVLDSSNIWYYFEFQSAATDAEDVATHPYRVRPDDYATQGVWYEQIISPFSVVGGNVGIGMESTGSKLAVRGDNGLLLVAPEGTNRMTVGYEDATSAVLKLYYENGNLTTQISAASGQPSFFNAGSSVGIGTASPGSALAVNIASDGTLQDFEVADAVQGNITVATGTVSYNAFVGSHYTQLKGNQEELPIGAVVISTGEIVPCEANIEVEEKVETEVALKDALETVDVEVVGIEEIGEKFKEYRLVGNKIEKIMEPVYAQAAVQETRLKPAHRVDPQTGKIIKTDLIKKWVSLDASNKEYFPYIDTTNVPGDPRVYGIWFSKMSDDSKGAAFGQDNKPVYLIAQVGLFKIRVTDTAGNIQNGDYLETSSRPMEAQRQSSGLRQNSTVAKAVKSVDWNDVEVDPELGYKWVLIPCIL